MRRPMFFKSSLCRHDGRDQLKRLRRVACNHSRIQVVTKLWREGGKMGKLF